jgi:hypothetical protein
LSNFYRPDAYPRAGAEKKCTQAAHWRQEITRMSESTNAARVTTKCVLPYGERTI